VAEYLIRSVRRIFAYTACRKKPVSWAISSASRRLTVVSSLRMSIALPGRLKLNAGAFIITRTLASPRLAVATIRGVLARSRLSPVYSSGCECPNFASFLPV
jgi:hypothetical protein